MTRPEIAIIIIILALLINLTCKSGSASGDGELRIRCKDRERDALLKMKANLEEIKEGALSSWSKEEEKSDCCQWIGVKCHNKTGNVVSIDLSPSTFGAQYFEPSLRGNISFEIVDFEYLNYLSLRSVQLYDNSLISFIGGLTKLRHLDLSGTSLYGEIQSLFGNLTSLNYLNLSLNGDLVISDLKWGSRVSSLETLDLSVTNMSEARDWFHVVNSLSHLRILKLSLCSLPNIFISSSSISLSNSSKFLSILDLSQNSFIDGSVFQWLMSYSKSLVHLDLSYCPLKYIPESFGKMTSLKHLSLYRTELHGSIPESFANITSLTFLDLSVNQLEGSIPKSLSNTLTYLDLSKNTLEGSIPQSLGNMTALEYLDLSFNALEGEIPNSIWELCALRYLQAQGNNLSGELRPSESQSKCSRFALENLDLSGNRISGSFGNFTLYSSLVKILLEQNHLNGSISESIGQLSKLEVFDVSENSIRSVISEAHFSKLFNLWYLDLSSNSEIVFNVHSDWIPHFQLHNINLGSCKLGPHFPNWLRSQTDYAELDISNSGISDSLPNWFWNLSNPHQLLNLSNNAIRGTIQAETKGISIYDYTGQSHIDLSLNRFEGPIPTFLLQMAKSLRLSRNRFSDLSCLCNLDIASDFKFLDVSDNRLSGEIPDCWSNVMNLKLLSLANNNLTGKIPTSLGFLTRIGVLHLSNNSLTGEFPSSFKNFTVLEALDLGENNLSGQIPAWIGKDLEMLVILSLRSNNFDGSLPLELCHLQRLQVLDLSSNSLSRTRIPNCIGNITAMKGTESYFIEFFETTYEGYPNTGIKFYADKLPLVWKGTLSDFKNLGFLKSVDLSGNGLRGEIPREISELVGLVSLNLSRNNLTGQIPYEIGRLKSLDVLDLSKNRLFGEIPSSLSRIDRLNTLDLSRNNLSGEIPAGPQLQNRDASAYMENPGLCGEPLPKKCADQTEPTIHGTEKEDEEEKEYEDFITKGFYISAVTGFVIGFWSICGTLIVQRSFRYGYFKILDNIGDWLYVTVALHKAKFLRIIKS